MPRGKNGYETNEESCYVKCFSRDRKTGIPGRISGLAAYLSCRHKHVSVGNKCLVESYWVAWRGEGIPARALGGFSAFLGSFSGKPENDTYRHSQVGQPTRICVCITFK